MKLYELEPEVAGGFGENTVFSNLNEVEQKRGRSTITHLNYEFSGWLGDELLETTPCFIVTMSLANDIEKSDLKGYKFEDVEISTNDEFKELYPMITLPEFKRIIPKGTVAVNSEVFHNWSGDDFCISNNFILIVSERALNILKKHKLNYCDVRELNSY
ncbi:MAG: hypothetical protein NTX45_24890 [Proteobacteria bacterium]|nr:hypothetical protein [Pseudomonadota bacterium]